jgi:methyl-accepting chemotaxis protein
VGVVVVAAMLIALTLGIVLSNSITGPLQKGVVMMQEMSLGHLSNRLNMERQDEIGTLARAMDQFSDDLRNIVVSAMKKIAAGDLTVEILKKDERDEISPALQGTLQALNGLIAEMTNMSTQQDAGDLDVKIDVNRFQGAYRTMAQGVNEMVFGHIAVKRKAMACVAEFGRGNFEAPLEKFPGKKAFINETIEEVRSNLKTLSAETGMLSKAAVEGRLSTRANVGAFKGDWAALVKGMNDTLDAVIGPLNVAAAYVDKIAGGVVPPLITETYHGDFNTLKNNLNRMSDRLREMLTGISDAANNLSSATAEILAATTQQASGASEQSAAISQTTTTVEEVKASAEQASMRAQDVATASQRTVEVARSGQTSVQATIESMGVIKERVEGISENLLALSDQTQQIGEIIAKVNEIASQSNMLALNASVEAARAGEHGKGFAVVATEVRSLAEQSRQATEQIKAILSEIQKATNSTVMATEEGVKGVDRGVQLSAQSRESIEQLAAVINESAQVAAQVVASGQQQQTGIDQIALAMQNINQVTMQSLASTRQTEKSAQNLNELARKMSEILAQYRF